MDVLVVEQEGLFLLVNHPHLVNQILGSSPLIFLLHQAGHSLIRLKELSLVLVDNLLVLFPLSLELKIVGVDVLLEIEVFLKKLVPSPRALGFPLLQLIDNSSVANVFLREVLQELAKDHRLLVHVLGISDSLQGHLHVLLEVIDVLLLQIELFDQLNILSFQNQVLFGEVLAPHLFQ